MFDGTGGTGILPNLEDENIGQGNMDVDTTIGENHKGFHHNALVVGLLYTPQVIPYGMGMEWMESIK